VESICLLILSSLQLLSAIKHTTVFPLLPSFQRPRMDSKQFKEAAASAIDESECPLYCALDRY